MWNMFDRGVAAGLLKLVLIVILGFSCTAWALGASTADREPEPPPATSATGAALSDESSNVAIGHIASEYPMLRMLSYAALAIGVVCGLLVYLWRRRGLRSFAITAGATATLVIAGLSFALFSELVLSPETSSCSTARLNFGTQRERYDDACREARERAANAFGLVSLYRSNAMREGADATLPVASGVVKTLSWLSLLTVSLLLYLLLRPLALKLAVKR